jgi:hypothetical protein
MGLSQVKVPNINIDTLLNRPQNNNSNILPSINCHSNTPLDESKKHAYKEPNKNLTTHFLHTNNTYLLCE